MPSLSILRISGLLLGTFLLGLPSARGPGAMASSNVQDPPPAVRLFEGAKTIVLLGNGLIEESQASGYIETLLNRRFPDRRLVIRNIGWTGDTVWAKARTPGYQNPSGLDRLKKQTAELKPDLILVGYGLTESFSGSAGLQNFSDGYGKLLDLLAGITPHLILLSPAPHEDLGRPYPDPEAHNRSLEAYAEAIRGIADHRHLPFVDLFHGLEEAHRAAPQLRLSTNGILLGDYGYWQVARILGRDLGLVRPPCRIELGKDGEVRSSAGAKISEVARIPEGIQWKVLEDELPAPLAPGTRGSGGAPGESPPILAVAGLAEGEWTLQVDHADVATATALQWSTGVALTRGPSFDQVESLRRAISKRNGLFTRRWRPTNDWPAHYTYIAPDFAMYDGLVAEQEEAIAGLSTPATRAWTLLRKKP